MQKHQTFKKVHSHTDHVIDKGTSEVLDIIQHHYYTLNKKLKYVFIMDNKELLKILSGAELKVFIALALRAEMDTGIIHINRYVRQEVAEDIGLTSEQTIADIISKIVNKKVLLNISRGTHKLNPDYAWRGNLKELEKLKNQEGGKK